MSKKFDAKNVMVNAAFARIQTIEVMLAEVSDIMGAIFKIDGSEKDIILAVDGSGAVKLRMVEEFRESLLEGHNQFPELAKRFAEGLPEFWFVQNIEDYDPNYTPEQNALQEFNCSRARFNLALNGGNDTSEVLWRSWYPAIFLKTDPRTDISTVIEVPLLVNGKQVYALANDSVVNSRPITTNPRIDDVKDVLENAFAFFIETNKDATHNVNEIVPSGSDGAADTSDFF